MRRLSTANANNAQQKLRSPLGAAAAQGGFKDSQIGQPAAGRRQLRYTYEYVREAFGDY